MRTSISGKNEVVPASSGTEDVPTIAIRGRRLVWTVVILCVLAELLFVYLDATVNYARGTGFGMIRRLCNIRASMRGGNMHWSWASGTLMSA